MSARRQKKTTTVTDGKLYGYVRVSHVVQVEEGESLDVQEQRVRGYAQMHGREVARVFIERAVSGGKPFITRPEGKQLMTALRPGDTVVAAKLDRMFRNTEDALRMVRLFREQHVKLVLLDIGGEVTNGGAIAEVFFTLLSAFASFERARISERIRDVKAHAKAKGVKYSRIPPFGWEHAPDKTLREVPSQQEAIRRMLQMREQGATYRDIADTLKAEGVCTLTYEAVRNIIARGGLRPGARP